MSDKEREGDAAPPRAAEAGAESRENARAPEGDAAPEAAADNEAAATAEGDPWQEPPAGDGDADDAAPAAEVERLSAEVEEAREQVLRAQAEVQNTRRRAEQDVERARKYALERFAGELLPIVDNLERALEAADSADERVKPIAEGVELTLKNFFSVLAKFSIEPVDPQGEPFDPQLHQAMSNVENAEVEPNTVVAVMQKGYTLNGRLVRPAMVMVSKPPSGDAAGQGGS